MTNIEAIQERERAESIALASRPPSDEASRASRALISSSTSLPAELTAKLPLPPGSTMYMVIHQDRTLPHFQGRLLSGECIDGKNLCCNWSTPSKNKQKQRQIGNQKDIRREKGIFRLRVYMPSKVLMCCKLQPRFANWEARCSEEEPQIRECAKAQP